MNSFLEYYGKHNISPVHQVNVGRNEFIRKRRNLYRQLGIPLLAIRGSDILEIGPAGGHNSLLLISMWGGNSLDLVEPNQTGRDELAEYLKTSGVSGERYHIYGETLETFKTAKKYDIVIAEQFIQHCKNWKELLFMLKRFTKKDTIVIITAVDPIGLYVESVKRLTGHYFVKDVDRYDEKVELLAKQFDGSLQTIAGMTRSAKDWVADWILNPAMLEEPMTMVDVIKEYQDEFDILGSSQAIFEDFSWYKDTSFDYIAAYREQYDRKKHIFLIYDAQEKGSVRSAAQNEELEYAVLAFLKCMKEMETENCYELGIVREKMDQVERAYDSGILRKFHQDVRDIWREIEAGRKIEWDGYPTYQQTFGRSSQYISFQKRQ